MKLRSLSVYLAALTATAAFGDVPYGPLLERLESNNPSMKVRQLECDAAKQENNTGLNLANPEVEYIHLWGNYSRINVDVSQTFDFATLSGGKKRVARGADAVADAEYAVARRDFAVEAETVLTSLAFYIRLLNLYDARMENSSELARLSALSLEKGEKNLMEHTSLLLAQEQLQMEAASARLEYDALQQRLSQLNGNQPLRWDTPDYDAYTLPEDFDAWFDANVAALPDLQLADRKVELGKQEVSLSKSSMLPDFSVGYSNELVANDNLHGFTVGLALPLWGNSGTVKASKAKLAAARASRDDEELRLRNDLRQKYDRAVGLKEQYKRYNNVLGRQKVSELLKKTYEAGEISLPEYLSQLDELSALEQTALEMERDYRLAVVEFKQGTF